ncbi:MAG: caspase family protein [Cyanobacteria bacterium P01_B01_bin.77]
MTIRKRWAFLVGINSYYDYGRLRYCVDDVLALESLLTAAGYTVWCLHDRMEEKDADGNLNRFFPKEKNIEGRLADFCGLIKEGDSQDDLLLVYFACHGSRQHDDIPRLIAHDTQQSLENEAISIEKLEEYMEDSGAGCRMLMLDACQIGLGTSNLSSRGTSDPELLEKIHEMAKGYALLAASSDHQDAKEWGGMKHGVFSYYILSGLSGDADLSGKGYVTVNDVAGYVFAKMQDWAANHPPVRQTPRQRVEDNLGGFILIPKEYEQAVAAFKPASPDELPGNSTSGIQSRGTAAQVNERLGSLDYDPQCQAFKVGIPRSQRAVAFVVQARDRKIQKWLVKRLFNQIPNASNASVFAFTVPRHAMGRIGGGIDNLWESLAKSLHCSAEPNIIIEALIKKYRTKPIIVAMYGWSRHLQSLQKQILEQFWKPLAEAVGAMDQQPTRSRLILFLAEGSAITEPSVSANTPLSSPAIPIRLEPLTEIQPADIQQWMDSDTVHSLLNQYIPEGNINTLIDEQILTWSSDPVEVIQGICDIFELDIEDIQKDWELT